MEFIARFKNALFLILILLAQAIALAVQVRTTPRPGEPDSGGVRLIRLWATATVTPFERAIHGIGYEATHGWSDYIDLRHVRQQNEQLRQQVTRMRLEEAAISEDALEGRRLQALLGFKEKYIGSMVAAQVIGASGSEQSHVLTIDKGSNDGLQPDMPVVTPDGIVGKLRDVFPTTAEVLEINDPNAGAGVILGDTRIRAILHGTVAGQVEIGNLTSDSRIKPGEQVITSGGDQIYPRGLPVGKVVSIAPDPDHQPFTNIRIQPAVNLDRVEEVLIITHTQPDPTQQGQQDLDAAAAQHAADLSAEKLPSIHEDQPAAQPGASTPAGATSAPAPDPWMTIPHPLPTVHPDQYTSGATPPASQLTPGSRIAAPDTSVQDAQPRPAKPEASQPQ